MKNQHFGGAFVLQVFSAVIDVVIPTNCSLYVLDDVAFSCVRLGSFGSYGVSRLFLDCSTSLCR